MDGLLRVEDVGDQVHGVEHPGDAAEQKEPSQPVAALAQVAERLLQLLGGQVGAVRSGLLHLVVLLERVHRAHCDSYTNAHSLAAQRKWKTNLSRSQSASGNLFIRIGISRAQGCCSSQRLGEESEGGARLSASLRGACLHVLIDK